MMTMVCMADPGVVIYVRAPASGLFLGSQLQNRLKQRRPAELLLGIASQVEAVISAEALIEKARKQPIDNEAPRG